MNLCDKLNRVGKKQNSCTPVYKVVKTRAAVVKYCIHMQKKTKNIRCNYKIKHFLTACCLNIICRQ